MKKFFMIALMAVAALTASAQTGEIHITPHVGIGYANVSNLKLPSPIQINPDKMKMNDFSDLTSYTLGAEVEYMVSDNFGVSGGLDYFLSKSGEVSESTENYSFEAKDMYFTFSYLNIPLLAQYHFGQFAVKAGLQPGFKLAADYHSNGDKAKAEIESFSLSLPVGVSYQFNNSPIVMDLRCAIPLTKMNKNKFPEGDLKLTSVILSAGYRF